MPLCALLLVLLVLLCELPQAAHTTAPLTNTAHTPRALKTLVSLVRRREPPRVYPTAGLRPTPLRDSSADRKTEKFATSLGSSDLSTAVAISLGHEIPEELATLGDA